MAGNTDITGNLTNSSSGSFSNVIYLNHASGTTTITGNVTGGTAGTGSNDGIHAIDGILVIDGNVTGGSDGDGTCYGIHQTGPDTVTVSGTITGGTVVTTNSGYYSTASGTGTLTAGGVIGATGRGIDNYAAQTMQINGNVIGATAHGINCEGTVALTVTGSVRGGTTLSYHGIRMSLATSTLSIGEWIEADGYTTPIKARLNTALTVGKYTVDGTSYTAGGGGTSVGRRTVGDRTRLNTK
jgi:hypothetical protein